MSADASNWVDKPDWFIQECKEEIERRKREIGNDLSEEAQERRETLDSIMRFFTMLEDDSEILPGEGN